MLRLILSEEDIKELDDQRSPHPHPIHTNLGKRRDKSQLDVR
jgi:hypothetical protein